MVPPCKYTIYKFSYIFYMFSSDNAELVNSLVKNRMGRVDVGGMSPCQTELRTEHKKHFIAVYAILSLYGFQVSPPVFYI